MRLLLSRLLAALPLVLAAEPAVAAWHKASSKHFIIYGDMRPDELKDYAERLERFDLAVRRVRGMSDLPLTDSERLTIFVLRSENAIAKLAGRSASGFYHASVSGSYAFVPRIAGSKIEKLALDADSIFFHEYAHHLQLRSAKAAIPAWIVEGFAEFFATAKIEKDGSVIIGLPPLYRARGLFRLDALTIEEMLGGSGKRLSAEETELLYGRGWLLTHYLTFDASRDGQLKRYLDSIQQGVPPLQAAKDAFGDLRALDRELDRYMRQKFMAVQVNGRSLPVGNVAIRPLDAGEAATIAVHMRSRRGVDQKAAIPVANDARKAAAPFPKDAFAQAALAEAEFDVGNYEAAEAAADRALAVDPNYVRALIYKGRARMELARKTPGKANWNEVRDWLARANRLDTENGEPMMLYFQTYLAEGARPSKNAVDGLLYAVELAPRDYRLRVNAVRQLLVEGRLAEAKDLFAPLAFQPHTSEKFRVSNAKVMEAILAKDSRTAVSVLDSAMQDAGPQPGKP
jgi:tetratricopeptide (TPR) repeat protein